MLVETIKSTCPTIQITLDQEELGHLLSILLHAKFSNDVRLEIVGAPTMRSLLKGVIEARRELQLDKDDPPNTFIVDEREGGLNAPPSFHEIERGLKRLLGKEDVASELAEDLYPFTWIKANDPS